MNNEVISYILHFELPMNSIGKDNDNIYFNDNYCEIIKKGNSVILAAQIPKNKITYNIFAPFTVIHGLAKNLENRFVNCIYGFVTKQGNNYDDIIRL